MLEPDPVWHADDHLERVYRRGRELRRRRRAVFAVAPVALVVVGVFVVGGEVSHSARPVSVADGGSVHGPTDGGGGGSNGGFGTADRGSNARQHGGAHGGESGNAAAAPTAAPQIPSPSPGGAVTPAASNQTATGQPSAQTSNHPAGPPGPGPGPGPNTAAPTASTTAACPASALDYSTITDQSSYTRGQPVTISLVVRNHSNRPCNGPGPCGVGPWASVQTTSGATVWQSHPIAVACSNPPPAPPRLAPGQSATYQAGTWNQVVCASGSSCSSQAAPGTYRAVAHRGNVNAAGTRFTVN